eukprot:1335498-Rhodomonas_salina.1
MSLANLTGESVRPKHRLPFHLFRIIHFLCFALHFIVSFRVSNKSLNGWQVNGRSGYTAEHQRSTTRCPVLTFSIALSASVPVLTWCMELSAYAFPTRSPVSTNSVVGDLPMQLPVLKSNCYQGGRFRSRYCSSNHVRISAQYILVPARSVLRTRYEMSGTDTGYAATGNGVCVRRNNYNCKCNPGPLPF